MTDTTFVLPTLGTRPDWLALSANAVRSQSCPVNLVIVGPDNEAIRKLAESLRAVHIVEKGRSLSAAINQGVREDPWQSKYVGWIADDDVLAPRSVELTRGALERKPTAPFAFGRVRYIDQIGRSKWLLRPGRWSVPYARFGRNFIPQPGSLQSRLAWEKIGGLDESLVNAMDLDLFLRMAEIGRPVYVADEVASFRVHAGSISVVKAGAPSEHEATQVAARYRRTAISRFIQPAFRVSDRLLLSIHPRIHGPKAPTNSFNYPYHVDLTRSEPRP